jgi:hypothetical protein
MDIILTGMARSGTTLSCALLNKLPQSVALHEPMNPAELVGLGLPEPYMARIASFFATQRASLLATGTAVSKARDGRVPDNPFESVPATSGLRISTVENQEVYFEKRLQHDFRLVIKQPNFFTATLATLLTGYPCYAIVRNPLAALLSWHSIQAPVNDGHLPYGEAFDAELKSDLAAEPDRLGRQLIILKWYYSRYASLLPRDHVIRYEHVVESGGRALAVIDPAAATLAEPLESRNTSTLYDARLVCHLADRLLEDDSIYRSFYCRSDIDNLCARWIVDG